MRDILRLRRERIEALPATASKPPTEYLSVQKQAAPDAEASDDTQPPWFVMRPHIEAAAAAPHNRARWSVRHIQ
eukprot:NODE_22655_length_700_cov_1.441536.p3 GENE.NODE_22655_length_700_cov_1.441536~~NODE_22655_length_700_cov_1.441536.p3  ORF type:complete len:74 (+),score=24.63 NODE_22655_length_700_cov_1.441536:301-522(+)